MLEIADQLDPVVLALFPDGELRAGEIRVVEQPESNCDHVGKIAAGVMNCRSALGAKVVGDPWPRNLRLAEEACKYAILLSGA